MPDQQPAKGPEPGNGPFDDPAMTIGAQATAILVPAMQIVAPVRTGQDDAPGGEPFPQRVAVVGAVAEQVVGIAAVRRTRVFRVASTSVTSVGDAAVMVMPRGIP